VPGGGRSRGSRRPARTDRASSDPESSARWSVFVRDAPARSIIHPDGIRFVDSAVVVDRATRDHL